MLKRKYAATFFFSPLFSISSTCFFSLVGVPEQFNSSSHRRKVNAEKCRRWKTHLNISSVSLIEASKFISLLDGVSAVCFHRNTNTFANGNSFLTKLNEQFTYENLPLDDDVRRVKHKFSLPFICLKNKRVLFLFHKSKVAE